MAKIKATIRAYTTIEQSKRLAEIIQFESADMSYIKHSSSDNPNWEFNEDFPPMILGDVSINEITAETLPCWSLAALLGVLPEIQGGKPIIALYDNYITYLHLSDLYTKADNLVDACYEMILKLNELKLM